MDHNYYMLGVAAGMATVILVMALWRRRLRKRCQEEYDERQLILRGKCYRVAFFTLVLLLAFNGGVAAFLGRSWAQPGVDGLLLLFAATGVFVVSAIWQDAYVPVTDSAGKYCILMGLVMLAQVPAVVSHIQMGDYIEGGQITSSVLPLASLLLFTVVFLAIVLRTQWRRKDDGEDE